jgi:pimeloyl-ACP methyl ester carboxylesterase
MTQALDRRRLLHLGGAATISAAASGCTSVGRANTTTSDWISAAIVSSAYIQNPSTYLEVLYPRVRTEKPPIVLIHGAAHTGACFTATADGRPGWAQYFLARGYPVVIPDWPGMGRSGYIPYETLTGETVVAGLAKVLATLKTPAIVLTHSMSGPFGWKLMERHGEQIAAIVAVAPGASGNVAAPVEVVSDKADALEVRLAPGGPLLKFSKTIPFASERGWALRKLIGDGNRFPSSSVDTYLASLTVVPPRLLLERVNYQGGAPRVTNVSKFEGKRIAVVQAPHDADNTVAVLQLTVNWLVSAGASVDFIQLRAKGIDGNGHMMMLESNSDEIASGIVAWIEMGRFPDSRS